MAIRLVGLSSGLDTDSMVTELTAAYQTKVDNAKGEQTKLQWTKDAWAELNTKLYNFYTGALAEFSSVGTYRAKKITSSADSKVSFTTSNSAVNGTHKLSVSSLASASYLTGAKISSKTTDRTTSYVTTSGTTLAKDILDSKGNARDISGSQLTVTDSDGNEATLTVGAIGDDVTLDDVAADLTQQLRDQGINDLTVGYSDGAFVFTNSSATEETTEEDGETKTTYTGGTTYTVKAADENSASALGVTEDGISVASQVSGATANTKTASKFAYETMISDGAAYSASTKLSDMGIDSNAVFSVTVGGETQTFTIDQNTTLSQLATGLSKLGVTANYDAGQGRFYINAAASGTENDFTITCSDPSALETLGLGTGATKVEATDAVINYNGVEYVQGSNNFSINGLNFTVKDLTTTTDADGNVIKDDPITISIETDVEGIYDKIKNFLTEYNSLLEEMNTLYNAESASDYAMLTDDQKDEMSDTEIENWENKIKSSLLRRDDTLNSLITMMRKIATTRVDVTLADGTTATYGLSTLGINTGNYSENGKLHIYGDSTDTDYADKDDKLMALLQSDPQAVLETLSGIGSQMYSKFQTAMKSSNLSSALTFYNDKDYDTKISDYADKITELQEKMTTAQEKYYSQFATMETKLAELNAQLSYITSMLG